MTLSLLIFAILGVELFSGKFHCCSDPSRIYQEGMSGTWGGDPALECSGNITDPLSGEQVAREWRSDMPNFDNTLQALLTLFQMTTLEDWDAVMQKVTASLHPCQIPGPAHARADRGLAVPGFAHWMWGLSSAANVSCRA